MFTVNLFIGLLISLEANFPVGFVSAEGGVMYEYFCKFDDYSKLLFEVALNFFNRTRVFQ